MILEGEKFLFHFCRAGVLPALSFMSLELEMGDMSEISAEQIQQVKAIIDGYKKLECVECAQEIRDYLISQGVRGKRIKLYTGEAIGWNSNIYDDSVPGEAISVNGRHEAIAIILNNVEIVFDNHHPSGLPRDEWMANLQFHDKILNNQQFESKEEKF
jgi:hypothetical protein